MNNLKAFSAPVLRIGIALIFLWFGTNQILDVSQWIGFIPTSIVGLFGISAAHFVYINGTFEIISGSALLLGLYTRFTAFILALHMFDIAFIVGLDSIGIRDIGLAIATTTIWLSGSDWFSLDRVRRQDIVGP